MLVRLVILFVLLLLGALYSIHRQKLTVTAALVGCCIATAVYAGTGFTGIAIMSAFFILATLTTQHKTQVKKLLGLYELKGARNAGQVIANAGIGGILGLLLYMFPSTEVFKVMLAGGFASATADTVSTELGNVYGKNYYNILSGKKDNRGTDGVVSLEGTFAGLCGAIAIATIYGLSEGNARAVIIITVAGFTGNTADSILGATLERKDKLTNNQVNFINTVFGALTAMALYQF